MSRRSETWRRREGRECRCRKRKYATSAGAFVALEDVIQHAPDDPLHPKDQLVAYQCDDGVWHVGGGAS